MKTILPTLILLLTLAIAGVFFSLSDTSSSFPTLLFLSSFPPFPLFHFQTFPSLFAFPSSRSYTIDMSKKTAKTKKDTTYSLLDILWRIVAPILVAVCHTLWNVYGSSFLALIKEAFTI